MKCPSCGHDQADRRPDCEKCQIIFDKWQTRQFFNQASVTHERTLDEAPVKAAMKGLPRWVYGLGVVVLGVIGWTAFKTSTGLPVPANAYRNDAHGFAVSTPANWVLLTPETMKDILATHGTELPDNLREGHFGEHVAVYMARLGDTGQFGAEVNIVSMQARMPELSESDKAEASKYIVESIKSKLPSYIHESTDLIDVDNLKALRVIGKASSHVLVQAEVRERKNYGYYSKTEVVTPAAYADVETNLLQVVIPGAHELYLITCSGITGDFETHRAAFDEIVNSFRVLDRPSFMSRFGSSGSSESSDPDHSAWERVLKTGYRGGFIGTLVFFAVSMRKRE